MFKKSITMFKKILFVFVCCIWHILPSFSQSEQSDSLFAIGVNLYNSGKYEEAIPLFVESDSLDKAELDSTSNRRDYSAMWLASCYYHIGDTLHAQSTHEFFQFSPIDRRLTVESDSLSEIGMMFYQNNDLQNAIKYFLQTTEMERNIIGERHIYYGNSILNCSFLYLSMNDLKRALEYMKEYCTIVKYNYGEMSIQYIEALMMEGKLLSMLTSEKQLVDILNIWERTLYICEKVLGKEHPNYKTILSNIETLQFKLGNYAEAIRLGEESLKIQEKLLGKEHPEYAKTLATLASYQYYQGNCTEAIRLCEMALSIYERVFGKQHPDYAESLSNLAGFHACLGNYTDAIHIGEEALYIREKILGKKHSDYSTSLSNLIGFYVSSGNYTDAIRLGKEALRICEIVYVIVKK